MTLAERSSIHRPSRSAPCSRENARRLEGTARSASVITSSRSSPPGSQPYDSFRPARARQRSTVTFKASSNTTFRSLAPRRIHLAHRRQARKDDGSRVPRGIEQALAPREVPAWTGTSSSLATLAHAPKHHLADPALAARLLGVGSAALLDFPHHGPPIAREGSLLGSLFESLITLCVRVYAEASRATLHHLRTRRGEHEVDLIVRRDDGRFVAIEVKLGSDVTNEDVQHLRWLGARVGDALLDSVVVTTGPGAYRRSDGIAVVPAAVLGP
jgi:hypothetical protein